MKIESIHIKNYRALRDVSLPDLPGLSVFVGANGTGKSTLFDVFGFLHDSLIHNVRQALAARGGFQEVVSRGQAGPIEIELKFREKDEPLTTYLLAVGLADGVPVVEREVLKYRRGQFGQPWKFLDFRRGHGEAVTKGGGLGEPDAKEGGEEEGLWSPPIPPGEGPGC